MTVITIAVLFLIAATRTSKPAPGGAVTPSGDSGAQRVVPRVAGAVHSSGEVGGGYARSVSNPRGSVTVKKALGTSPERCPDYRLGLNFYRARYAIHVQRRTRNHKLVITGRKPRNCPDARYLASVYRQKARNARRAYERWVDAHTLRDPEVRPGNDAWEKAVQEAQRAYPGTRSWLLSCSASEGGWGRWVPNSDGAPPGGWLQMHESTFWRMWATARVDVHARGFRVPASAASWYSPLGQALAGAWGLTHGRRHEWAGYGC